MKFRWIVPLVILMPQAVRAVEPPVKARVETQIINPEEITPLHLRPGFISTIRMPEEVNSVALGSRGDFTADHSEGEPRYVFVKAITKDPAQSNLIIATRSGLHVTLELISDGSVDDSTAQPVDFLLEYRLPHTFLISSAPDSATPEPKESEASPRIHNAEDVRALAETQPSELDTEYELQARINSPAWTKWDGQQVETFLGDIRQWGNRTIVSYSIFNSSDHPVEIVPPQVQIAGHKRKKKKKEGKAVISDQLEVRYYKLSATRLGPGERVDGVAIFDRPNFKQSTEKLFLQIAQADQVDRPILIRLPFTPPASGALEEGSKR